MDVTRMRRALQENALTMLVFSDEHAAFIRNTIDLDLYDRAYRDIAQAAYEYIDRYGRPPKEHIADLLEEDLEDDEGRGKLLLETLKFLFENQRHVNEQYVLDQLAEFVRAQSLYKGIIAAAERLQESREDALDEAERIIMDSVRRRVSVFDPGVVLSDTSKVLAAIDLEEEDAFPTGIPELDRRALGPKRQELHLFIGAAKSGKTWWMVNLAKRAMLRGLRIVHVSLEVSEEVMLRRYVQAMFSVPKRMGQIATTRFVLDDMGRVEDMERREITPKVALESADAVKKLGEKMKRWRRRFSNLIVKRFPTGQLTVTGLKAYLDLLEQRMNFIPDLLLLDYADLMYLETSNYRHELGRLYKDLRGLAVERNIALATASQSNREGARSRKVDVTNVAEDYSKIATADTIITISKTDQEAALGLARLFVAAARNDADRIHICLSQNYEMGQFVLDSALMGPNYSALVEELGD